jgi:hypothetical protein
MRISLRHRDGESDAEIFVPELDLAMWLSEKFEPSSHVSIRMVPKKLIPQTWTTETRAGRKPIANPSPAALRKRKSREKAKMKERQTAARSSDRLASP